MTDRITSVQNQRIKEAARLRSRDARDSQGRIIIDGAREISRAIDAGVEFVELFVCEESLREDARELVQRAADQGIPRCDVSPAVQSKLVFGERDEGVVAIAIPPQRRLAELKLPTNSVVAVLAEVEKPGNLGAVARSADAAGVAALIAADGATDVFNPNVIRASSGTIFSLPVVAASRVETLAWLRAKRFRIYATRVESSQIYTDADLTGDIAIVFGGEAAGLGQEWLCDDIHSISLPLLGVADSLNVSVTAGVLFYEALRQRGARPQD